MPGLIYIYGLSPPPPPQDCEIQVYGYKGVGDPQCLWTFCMKDSVLALDTEVEGGRVRKGRERGRKGYCIL